MSLEDAILKLTAAVERNTAAVEKVLASADLSADTATTSGTSEEEKPKRGRKPKAESADTEEEKPKASEKTEKPAAKSDAKSDDEDGDADEIDFGAVRKRLADWLGEFAKEEDKDNPDGMHPEAKARKEAVKAAITKLGGQKLTDIGTDQEKVVRLSNWLDKKLEADAGFGKGRLAADPEPAAADDDDDI